MPNRILKESICTSDTIDSLNPEEEVFFYRLIVQCDDHGLMDARLSILLARIYPLRLNSVSLPTVLERLMRLRQVGLLTLYVVGNRPYLVINNWEKHQQVRAKKLKYPDPQEGTVVDEHPEAAAINGYQMISETNDRNGNHLISDDIKSHQVISLAPLIQSNPIQSESNHVENATHFLRKKSSSESEPKPKPARPRSENQREQDALYESLVEAGMNVPRNDMEWGRVHKALKELRAAGETAETAPSLRALYLDRFENTPCTWTALAANVSMLRGPDWRKTNGHNGHRPPERELTRDEIRQQNIDILRAQGVKDDDPALQVFLRRA